jgi:hypothetical protein
MMAAFLDSLGIGHEDGLISEENVANMDPEKLRTAAAELATKYPPEDVSLYFKTLVSQDPDTWGNARRAHDGDSHSFESALTSAAARLPDSIAPLIIPLPSQARMFPGEHHAAAGRATRPQARVERGSKTA